MKKLSGRTTAHSHKFDDWKNHECNGKNSLEKVWFFDAQWSDCPVEVETEVKKLWREYSLGNDHYMIQTSIESLEEMHSEDISTELLRKFILEKEPTVKNDDTIILHWWW